MNITFFIPAFNCSGTITEAVDSIMETNFNCDDELIIVNDCSTDNTESLLNELKKKYPIIKIINHKKNKGGAAARNTSIENAGNELLFCLDSDNILAPGSIKLLKEYLVKMDADIASFQHQHFFTIDKYKPDYIWTLPDGKFDANLYYEGANTPGQHGNYLFTKQSWYNANGYAEGSGALDTWTFGLRQAITGATAVVLKDTYYYHRLDFNTSYWIRDAEINLWSVSIKSAYALLPFFDRIDEKFLNYMLGKGKYIWYYNLKNKPIKLIDKGAKDDFYLKLQKKTHDFVYPKPTILERAINKLKRTVTIKK